LNKTLQWQDDVEQAVKYVLILGKDWVSEKPVD